jgi:hypothetical protein
MEIMAWLQMLQVLGGNTQYAPSPISALPLMQKETSTAALARSRYGTPRLIQTSSRFDKLLLMLGRA